MPCEDVATPDVRKYLDADMVEPEALAVAGGLAVVASVRRPEKTGPNEDAAAVVVLSEAEALFIVADGCGGMANGEQASRIAVDSLVRQVKKAHAESLPMRGAILDGIEAAHRSIVELKNGAGATLAVVHVDRDEARPYHVGDSQILILGGRGKVKLLTTSHSPVGYAVESGLLEEHEAIDHEERHLVSNYLGCETMHVEMGSRRKLALRDAVLVASDGVLDNLLQEEIVALLRSGSVAKAAARLAGLARQRMTEPKEGQPHKPDDLTLIAFSRRGGK